MESFKQLKEVVEDSVFEGMEGGSGTAKSEQVVLKEKNLKNGKSSSKVHMNVTSLLNDVVQKSQISTMLIQPYLDPYAVGTATFHICYNPPNSQVFSIALKHDEASESNTARQGDTASANSADRASSKLTVTLLRKHNLNAIEAKCKQLFSALQKLCFTPAHKLLQGIVAEFVQPHRGPWY